MRILHLNTSDSSGGAAKSALRLHRALRKSGVDSRMLVQERLIDDPLIYGPDTEFKKVLSVFRPYLDRLPLLLSGKGLKTLFYPQWLPNRLERKIFHINPDIIHLHWICGGFVNISMLKKINKPIVWTLHDMWPFTGGCHISLNCESYKEKCGWCPQLGSKKFRDISFITLARKKRNWYDLNINVVTPSRWLAKCSENSTIFRKRSTKIIHNGVDLKRFKPFDQVLSREFLNLPIRKKYILFGSIKGTSNKNKGFDHLVQALKILSTKKKMMKLRLFFLVIPVWINCLKLKYLFIVSAICMMI